MRSDQTLAPLSNLAGSGIEGLDYVLAGDFQRNRHYLVEGEPEIGKTTLALQFLIEGVSKNEKCLYIPLAETETELRKGAASHEWDLEGTDIFEIFPPSLLDGKIRGRSCKTNDRASDSRSVRRRTTGAHYDALRAG